MAEFIHLLDSGGRLVNTAPDEQAEQHASREISALGSLALSLPNAMEGLNLDRVDEYAQKAGLSDKPTKYLNEDDYTIATARVETSGHSEGVYVHLVGILFVKRNVALESLNGPGITESFTIHEKAHATHIPTPFEIVHSQRGRLFWKRHETMADTTRSGFKFSQRNGGRGIFLEEGYAELERGRYVEQQGLVNDFTAGAVNYDEARGSAIPMRYFYKQTERGGEPSLTIAPGALAATVLDSFVNDSHKNLQIMRSARQNAAGLSRFIRSLNVFMPGLYSRLMHANQQELVKLIRELRTKP